MIKFLLILILFIYLLYRVGGFFFRLLFSQQQQQFRNYQNHQNHQQQTHRPPDGNVRVDYVPKKDRKSREEFEGGQYVDFEEVK